jgi:hypothetical protein
MELFRVPIIRRRGRRDRKYGGTDYLILSDTAEDARNAIRSYLEEEGREGALHVGSAMSMTSGLPIAWTHYLLDPREVQVRIKRDPEFPPDPVEAGGLTDVTRDPDDPR